MRLSQLRKLNPSTIGKCAVVIVPPLAIGLSQDGELADFFLKTSPLSLMMSYRMSLISAGSISLDSTFKSLSQNYAHMIKIDLQNWEYKEAMLKP